MTVSYSTNLGLALPAQGDWAGSWGTNQNQFITQYLDAAIAGAQTISGSQTAVTLSTTNGIALSQAGSGATGSAQYAVINCTGNPASMLTITAPLTAKTYVIINATSTSQAVKIVGVGPTTGVTVAAARAAMVTWNGSDFVLVATTDASKLTGILSPANGGTGVANNSAATVTSSGNFPYTRTLTDATNVTFPTTGTLATRAGNETLTNKTISGADNTLSNIANASLTNSSVTINGNSVSLGGSTTVTATATNALTIGTGLSGTSYNGSSAVTIAIDSSVATLTGAQTLTNKTLTSPALNGTPTAPTASQGTNTTQVATTAFVQQALPGTTAGDIGSYMLATYSGPNTVNFGDTVVSSFFSSPYLQPVNLSATSVGSTVNGTFVCMGQIVTYGNSAGPYTTAQIQAGSTIWLRIS